MQIWQESKGSEASLEKMFSALADVGESTTAIKETIAKVVKIKIKVELFTAFYSKDCQEM